MTTPYITRTLATAEDIEATTYEHDYYPASGARFEDGTLVYETTSGRTITVRPDGDGYTVEVDFGEEGSYFFADTVVEALEGKVNPHPNEEYEEEYEEWNAPTMLER